MNFMLVAVIAVVALALLFDFTNGFHDAANSVATVVATRALPARWAPVFSAVFNFSAYFVVGTAVASTVAKVVNVESESVALVFSALIGAIAWNYATWYVGMPSSSSHAIIGGLVGAGLSAGGLHAINWHAVAMTAVAIVASPLLAFTVAFLAMFVVAGMRRLARWHDNARPFKTLQLISAAAVSFGHGANDAQKTMGLIAALLVASGHDRAGTDGSIPIAEWIPLAAYLAIAAGTVWGGWKIIETMGLRITTLHASSGLAANIGATTAIFGATGFGVPISTTHAAASSVTGAGVASGRGANLRVVGEMVIAWVVTIPATTAGSWVMYRFTQLPGAAAWLVVGSTLLVLGGGILYAMTHTITAADVEDEIPPELVLAQPLTARPQLEGHGPVS